MTIWQRLRSWAVLIHCRLLCSGWYSAEEVTQQKRGEITGTQGGGRRMLHLDRKLNTFSQSSQARSLSIAVGQKPQRTANRFRLPTCQQQQLGQLITSEYDAAALLLHHSWRHKHWDCGKSIISIKTARYSLIGIRPKHTRHGLINYPLRGRKQVKQLGVFVVSWLGKQGTNQ